MKISRVWAMPNKWTFQIRPILDLVRDYACDGRGWADPFAGKSDFAQYRNDLNPDNSQHFHKEAGEFLSEFEDGFLRGVIFDPPYSISQVKIAYEGIGLKLNGKENPTGGFPKVRDLISRKVMSGGHCISFGWNTVGMGINRGFEIIEILIVSHGGNRNDTLCAVERKI